MTWKAFNFALLLLALVACSDEEALERERRTALTARATVIAEQLQAFNADKPVPGQALVIQLAFGPEADLDLYVTDPLLETQYFANKKGRSGGVISEDRRCDSSLQDAQEIRIEEVRFEIPPSGRYRVGVDFPSRCDVDGPTGFEERAAYAIAVSYAGKQQRTQGTVGYQFFELAALDFDIDADQ